MEGAETTPRGSTPAQRPAFKGRGKPWRSRQARVCAHRYRLGYSGGYFLEAALRALVAGKPTRMANFTARANAIGSQGRVLILSRTPQASRKPSGEIAEAARVVLGVTVVLGLATSDFFAALGWAIDRFGKRWRALAQRVSNYDHMAASARV